jgi:CubicO group peptidase (beta-lactamase class C family)
MNNLRISKKSLVFTTTMMLTLVILLLIVGSATAQQNTVAPGGNVHTVSSLAQGPTDPAEMEAFLDPLFAQQMEEHNVAGAAISVVKDGKLFFSKGYGYADLENNIHVDAEKTLFKVGSVTKLFTWTAVMQLFEQGKLDLDADINTYLDFRIPDTYPQPITLRHLMTHTAGFEDLYFEVLTSEGQSQVPPGEWLASHIPERVRPPGESPAYSNYGAALAGYIVEQVSGESYSQYVQAHILHPLGMESSTAQWPTPPDLSAYESMGYMYDDGAFLVFPRLLGEAAFFPTGVIRSTAMDMARFMIAHLQNGRYSDANIPEARILEESTAQQMHSTLYTPDPRILGSAYGFFEFSDNGQRVIGHGGEAEPMHSLLLLLPDEHVGIFVSYNSTGGAALATQHFGFQRAFFDHYYPASSVVPIQSPADFTERIGRFTGSYRFTRSSYTTLEKFSGLFGAVEIRSSGDGALLLNTPWAKLRLVEVEPLYFRQADGPFEFVFHEDEQGQITYMFTSLIPQFALEKLKWYERPGFNIALLQGCVLIFLSVIPVALIRVIRNGRVSSDRKPVSRGARVAHWIILGISVLNLLFVLGTLQWLNTFQTYGVSLGVPKFYQIVLGLGVFSAVLTAAALVYTVLAWKNSYWSVAFRAFYTLVTIAAVAFVWFLNYWNLLGWRY